jgi:hypothetical protein
MPVTATYEVRCDVCFGVLDGKFETRDEALAARREAGWEDTDGRTACPPHNSQQYARA